MNTVAEAPYIDTGQQTQSQGFVLLYPVNNHPHTLYDVLDALYYLPTNYKLIILGDKLSRDKIDVTGYEDLGARIQYKAAMGVSPFSSAHAFILDGTTPAMVKPYIVVSQSADSALKRQGLNEFIVSPGNPLALASAVHRLARTAAF